MKCENCGFEFVLEYKKYQELKGHTTECIMCPVCQETVKPFKYMVESYNNPLIRME